MRILFDTNILLDALLAREPFVADATFLLETVESGQVEGFISATTVTDVHYLVGRQTKSAEVAIAAVTRLLVLMEICFDQQQIINSLQNEPIEPLTQKSITEFKTLVLATGVILVTYRIVKDSGSGEQPVHSLRSSIWKLNNDRWKMIFHQGTLVREL